MRNAALTRAAYNSVPLGFLALLLCTITPGFARESAQAATPSDANELMVPAEKTNGLWGPDLQPWHMMASYKNLNEDGSVKNEGTIEEFWASPTRYKVSYSSGAMSYTQGQTDEGFFNEGGAGMDLTLAFRAQREFLQPLPPVLDAMRGGYTFQQRDTGGIQVVCVQRQDSTGLGFTAPTWCLDTDNPELRLTVNANSKHVLHSNFTTFQGRSIARDLKFSDGELSSIESDMGAFVAHLETLEVLKSVDDAKLAPPPGSVRPVQPIKIFGAMRSGPATDALSIPKRVNISGGVAAGMLVQRAVPVYPIEAKQAGISGTVVLQATIGKDGRVADLRVISGPSELQQAALDAVRTWVYKPYLLNGESVSVNTTVNVVFTLGN